MSEEPGVTWQTKLKVVIMWPSQITGGMPGAPKTIFEAGRISLEKNREQTTIHTISMGRKGFITVERDYTFTMSVNETDENLYHLENLYDSNSYFDMALAQMDSSDKEWKIIQYLAIGCKFETARTTYDPMMLPVREYTAKYLRTSLSFRDKAFDLKSGDGRYSLATVNWNT